MNAFKIRSARGLFIIADTLEVRPAALRYFLAALLGSGLLFYANAGLTSAVRSKRGRGTLELSLPPLRLTHSPLLQPSSVPLTLADRHGSGAHHAYLPGAILPRRAGFY